MISSKPKPSPVIQKAERLDDGFYLYSEAQTLRLQPISDTIIRISATTRDAFTDTYGIGILPQTPYTEWKFHETEAAWILTTAVLNVYIHKRTASISYRTSDNTVICAEAFEMSRVLESFDSYKTLIDPHATIRQVQTADGLKNIIDNATQVFDKVLYHTTLNLRFQEDEVLYGLGQHEEGLINYRGTTQYLHQANMKIAIPMLVSSKGYGLLVPTGSPAIFNDTACGSYFYTEADPEMNYYFMYGPSMDSVIQGYRRLSGRAGLLPRWAFGYVQSQERYETQEEILRVASEFRKRDFGLDLIVLDWLSWEDGLWGQKSFDFTRFPDPSAMTSALHDMDVHFMISIWPTMAKGGANEAEMSAHGYLYPGTDIYDALNPDARRLYWKQTNEGLFRYGIDAWWCDSNEPFTPEWAHMIKPIPPVMYQEYLTESRKSMPAEYSNAYGIYHAQCLYEGQRGTGSEKRVVNLTRNGYVGSQRYNTILWSGDTYASWDTLRRQITSGLQFCISGLPFWTLDIGSFFVKNGMNWYWSGHYDEGAEDYGYRELYTRWFQYGAFLPIFRSHGTDVRREPWTFGEEGSMFYDALLKANHLRYQLLPYIYSCAGHVWKDDSTMMRMLAFDYPEDPKALLVNDQFMLGPSLMICPVTEPMYYGVHSVPITDVPRCRTVYLPKGSDWYDYYTDTLYHGGQTITIDAPIDHIPLFVKSGSILPMADGLRHAAMLPQSGITLHVYPGDNAVLDLYEDGGDGYDYENGEYSIRHFEWNEQKQLLLMDKSSNPWTAPVSGTVLHSH